MKFTKLSLAAIAAVGFASSAFAVENVKVDGSIKLWYQTSDTTVGGTKPASAVGNATYTAENDGIMKKAGAVGDLVAKLRATGDLTKKVGFGTTLYAATTMGLENNVVSGETIGNTSTESGSALNGADKNPIWLGEAYFVYKAGKTIAKIGRQELDTPLAYSETWNAAPNTFEAAVLVNQDLPDTTLVAAYVSRGNGYNSAGTGANAKTIATGGTFSNYHTLLNTAAGIQDVGGAYAVGMVNKSIPNLTIHPVYYDVLDTANAFWADATYVVPNIVKIEALYSFVDPNGSTQKFLDATAAASNKTTTAYAAQLSGEFAGVKLAGAYSSVSKGFLPVANTATGFKKTKIYTASILADGTAAGRPDTTAWKLSAGYTIAGIDLAASYAAYSVGKNDDKANWFNAGVGAGATTQGSPAGVETKPTEIDLSVSTKIDEINIALYYVNVKEAYKSAQTNGFTIDTQAVRVIPSINF